MDWEASVQAAGQASRAVTFRVLGRVDVGALRVMSCRMSQVVSEQTFLLAAQVMYEVMLVHVALAVPWKMMAKAIRPFALMTTRESTEETTEGATGGYRFS